MTPKEALKDADLVRTYIRVSTEGQEGTLPAQSKTVNEGLKRLGFKGKKLEFSEQGSGTKKDRPKLQELLTQLRADLAKGKKPIVVVRDFQRFTRDPVHYGALFDEFRDKGVRILSINEGQVSGTFAEPEPNADLLIPILIAAGGSEVNIRKQQTIQGSKRSQEKGIAAGSVPDMFRKEPGPHPLREMIRFTQMGLTGRATAKRLGRSDSYVKKNLRKVNEYLMKGGQQALDDWLDTIDLFRAFQNEKDEDVKGSKATVRMKTVQRMISGYLATPLAGFPKPTIEDLNEYYDNFGLYKKKSR